MSVVFDDDDGDVEKRLVASIANSDGDGGDAAIVGQLLTISTQSY